MCSRNWLKRRKKWADSASRRPGNVRTWEGTEGINHIRRSWGSPGSQACQWIKTAGTARREEGGPKLKLTLHTTGVSYHTAFLWFWAQNSGPQNADLFTDLSQSHSLLEKIRAVTSKLAVVFLPFSSLPETEPMPLCILHRHSPNLATSPGPVDTYWQIPSYTKEITSEKKNAPAHS